MLTKTFTMFSYFRIIDHLKELDPTASFLERYLRRKLVHSRVLSEFPSENTVNSVNNDDLILTHLVSWLPKVWKHVNKSSALGIDQYPASFGLRAFLACPLDVASAKRWFTDLWNNLFVPFIFKTRPEGHMKNSTTMNLNESFDWIAATWPWPNSTATSITPNQPSREQTYSPVDVISMSSLNDLSTMSLFSFGGTPSIPINGSQTNMFNNRTSVDSGIILDSSSSTFPTPTGYETGDKVHVSQLIKPYESIGHPNVKTDNVTSMTSLSNDPLTTMLFRLQQETELCTKNCS